MWALVLLLLMLSIGQIIWVLWGRSLGGGLIWVLTTFLSLCGSLEAKQETAVSVFQNLGNDLISDDLWHFSSAVIAFLR